MEFREAYTQLRFEHECHKNDLQLFLSNSFRQQISSKSAIITLNDIKTYLEDIIPVKIVYPGEYEKDKLFLIQVVISILSLKDSASVRADLQKQIRSWEVEIIRQHMADLRTDDTLSLIDLFKERFFVYYKGEKTLIFDKLGVEEPLGWNTFKLAHKSIELLTDTGKKVDIGTYFNQKYDDLPRVVKFMIDPTKPEMSIVHTNPQPVYAYNRWKGFSYDTLISDPLKHCPLIMQHVEDIISNNESMSFQNIIWWFAHMMQKPEEKPGIALFLCGNRGSGKDLFAAYVARMMHQWHTALIPQNVFFHKYNQWLDHKLFVSVSEMSKIRDPRLIARMNDYITAQTVTIEDKNEKLYTSNCICRFMFTSNEFLPISTTGDERRFLMLKVNNRMAYDYLDNQETRTKYFEALVEEMNGIGPAALYSYLKTYDLSKLGPIYGMNLNNQAIREMTEESQNSLELFITMILEQGMIPDYSSKIYPNHTILAEKENIIPTRVVQESYTEFIKEYKKVDPLLHVKPMPSHMAGAFIRGLGLEYEEGEQYKNRRKHHKMSDNKISFVLPPLSFLRKLNEKPSV